MTFYELPKGRRTPDVLQSPEREPDGRMGVIFDLDGVLVDTGWAHKQSWYDLAEKEGFSMTDEFFYSTFGMQNYQIIPMLLGRDASSGEVDRLSDWKELRYRELIAEKLAPSEGAESLLCDLKKEDFLLAVGSSAPRANLDLVLERTDLQDYFDAYVTGQDVTNGKPAPDTFLKAAEKLSLGADRCVVVEDAVQGVEAGKAAGMPVVAVTTTRKRADLHRADIIVDSLAQLQARQFIDLLRNRK
jgi:beta-phosphoglucomutase